MSNPRRTRGWVSALTLAVSLANGSIASAESNWLFGVSAGAALNRGPGTQLRFRVGAGADWIHHRGWITALRSTVQHDLTTSASTLVGWTPPPTLDWSTFGVALHLGPTLRLNQALDVEVGARALVGMGVWYRRVTVELDAALFRSVGRRVSPNWSSTIGLSLRLVPWDPMRT